MYTKNSGSDAGAGMQVSPILKMVAPQCKEVTRVQQFTTALVALIFIEVLLNFGSGNVLSGLLSLCVFLIPAAGWYGTTHLRQGVIRVFYVANAVCAAVYSIGVLALGTILIPAVRCMCDDDCRMRTAASAGAGYQMAGDGDYMFQGVDENLPPEYVALCRIGVTGFYITFVLSLAAAAVHTGAFFAGRDLCAVLGMGLQKSIKSQPLPTTDGYQVAPDLLLDVPPPPASAPGRIRSHARPTGWLDASHGTWNRSTGPAFALPTMIPEESSADVEQGASRRYRFEVA